MSQTTISTTSPPNVAGSLRTASLSNAELAALWSEACLTYPLYAALAVQFNMSLLPYPSGEFPPAKPTRSIFDKHVRWLDTIDEDLLAYQLRQVPSEILNASEPGLRSFIQRQLRKPDKTILDRDKVDWLLVQYFALCAPEELYRQEVGLEDVARVLQPVLSAAGPASVEWSAPVDTILHHLEQCDSLRDIMENGLLEQGRLLKDSAGCLFYDQAALVAFCRFNFLLRRTFIRLLHADLRAIQDAIEALEAKGVKTADCRRAGFSAAETTAQLRSFCGNWKQPFQKDYTESSVRRTLEQLLALRTDLEEALARPCPCEPELNAGTQVASWPDASRADMGGSASAEVSAPENTLKTCSPSGNSSLVSSAFLKMAESRESKRSSPVEPKLAPQTVSVSEAEECLEAISEQLIAARPSQGRSMLTVTLQDTKVLLSSWEVSAFLNRGSQESEDLRRAVVARALLAVGTDQRKRSGEQRPLASALALARTEISYFRGQVERAKQTKNTEAAVNLGISAKRLLSFIEEADKLQP